MNIKLNRARQEVILRRGGALLLVLTVLIGLILSVYGLAIPKTVSCFTDDEIPSYLGASFESAETGISGDGLVNFEHGQYKLFGTIPVKSVTVAKLEDVKHLTVSACVYRESIICDEIGEPLGDAICLLYSDDILNQ